MGPEYNLIYKIGTNTNETWIRSNHYQERRSWIDNIKTDIAITLKTHNTKICLEKLSDTKKIIIRASSNLKFQVVTPLLFKGIYISLDELLPTHANHIH